MTCTFCGKENPDGSSFCKYCGHPASMETVPVPASPAAALPLHCCPQCGKKYDGGQTFCMGCGTPLQAVPVIPNPITPAAPIPPVNPAFCKWCGAPVHNGMAFCAKCGKSLVSQQVQIPKPVDVYAYAGVSQNPGIRSQAPVNTAVLPVRKAKADRKLRTGLVIGVPVLALLVVLAIIVLPKLLVSKTTTEISSSGGQVTLDDFQMTIGDDVVDNSVMVTITNATLSQKTKPEGLLSPLYMIETDARINAPVTVRLALPDGTDTDNLMLGIGTEMVSLDGTITTTAYRFVEAEIVDGALESQVVPANYTAGIGFYSIKDTLLVSTAAKTTPAGTKKPQDIKFICGIFSTEVYYKDGGHFKLYYPNDKNSVNEMTKAYKLLDDLESVYNAFLEAGFNYDKRTTWPICVNITTMADEGGYVESWISNAWSGRSPEHGWIELNVRNFTTGYNREILKGIIGHEWFHFVQANYCTSGITSAWLADATATWYEGNVTTSVPAIIQQYIERMFDGVIPANGTDTAADGYARAPVIKYLIDKFGMKCILETYKSIDKGTDPKAALIGATADPAGWAADCYEFIVSGKAIDQDPFKFYNNICNKDPAATPFSSIVDLKTPTADEIAKAAADQTSIKVGQQQISIPALGARLVAIRADSSFVKALVDGASLVITVGGAPVDYRLFTIDGKAFSISKAGSGGVVVSDLKKALEGKNQFLLLITSVSDGDKKAVGLTVELQMNTSPTLDEIVGSYNDGVTTLQDVHVEQSVYDIINGLIAQGDNDAKYSLEGIADMLAQKGQSRPLSFDIRKTGDEAGELVGDGEFIEFTYKNGIITINAELKNDDGRTYLSNKGTLTATFDKDKNIMISGTITEVIGDIYTDAPHYFPDNSLYLVKQLTGSKPAS